MSSGERSGGLGGFELVVFGAATVVGAWWGGAVLAAALFAQSGLGGGLAVAVSALVAVPSQMSDPRRAWPAEQAAVLPGPYAYWVCTAVVLAVLVCAVWLVWLWVGSNLGQKRRKRLGQVVRGRFARRRELATLAVDGPTPGRFLLGRHRGWGDTVLATESRMHMTLPPRWRRRRRAWFQAHQFDRGAVGLFGVSRAYKSVVLTSGIKVWDGPMIISSVKGDLLEATYAERCAAGEVKVFDPTGSLLDADGDCPYVTANWSPVVEGMSAQDAQAAAKALSDAKPADTGTTNSEFFSQQATQLLAGLIWLAGNLPRDHSGVLWGVGQVSHWVFRLTPMNTDEGPSLQRAVDRARQGAERAGNTAKELEADRVEGWLAGVWAQAPETRGSVYANAQNMLWPWQSPQVEMSAVTNEIDLEWLLDSTGGRANTLYICAPPSEMRLYAPVFAGLLNDMLAQLAAHFNRSGKPLDPTLAIVVDEAGNTPINDLPEYASVVAGMGGLLITVWQSVSQIESKFGQRTGTLLANMLTKMLMAGQSDADTLEMFRKLIGEEEVAQASLSGATGGLAGHTQVQQSTTVTSMAPETIIRQMRVGDAVVIHGTLPPAHVRAIRWWEDPLFRARDASRAAERDTSWSAAADPSCRDLDHPSPATSAEASHVASADASHGPASDLSWACGNCGLFFEAEAEAIDCEVGHGDDTVSVDGDEEVAPM
jgi:type IV secretion system protein VirD4